MAPHLAFNYCLDWLIPPRSCISSPSLAESKAPGSHSGARSPERAPVCTDTSEAHSGNGSARTNMSDDDRTTPLGLFNYARSYWQSGVLLHDSRAKVTHPDAPVTLLLAHAIELYLKAFLRLRGLGIEEAKNSFGHALKSLLTKRLHAGSRSWRKPWTLPRS